MREIKFRVWDSSAKVMLTNVIVGQTRQRKTVVITNYNIDYAEVDFEATAYTTHNDKSVYEVMQCTGLKDKNGKEIWEGDIVECRFMHHGKPSETPFNAKVVYNEHIASFQISYLNIYNQFVNDEIGFRYQKEVIGNIHSNPELLK